MDNQEFLSLLNENAKTKEEVLREQEAEELRKQQEEKLKDQQNIRAFDQFICDRFKEVLVEAVSKGLAKNTNGKRIVEGTISFESGCIDYNSDNSEYYDHVVVEIKDLRKIIIRGIYGNKRDYVFSNRVLNGKVTLIPNCDCSIGGYRQFFREYKTIEYTHKTFWGKTKTTKGMKLVDNEEALASFVNFFNSELSGVARIVNHEYKENEIEQHKYDHNIKTFRKFFFKAEF